MGLASSNQWTGGLSGAKLDGHDMWTAITSNTPSPRQEIIHYVNKNQSLVSIQRNNLKLYIGPYHEVTQPQRIFEMAQRSSIPPNPTGNIDYLFNGNNEYTRFDSQLSIFTKSDSSLDVLRITLVSILMIVLAILIVTWRSGMKISLHVDLEDGIDYHSEDLMSADSDSDENSIRISEGDEEEVEFDYEENEELLLMSKYGTDGLSGVVSRDVV